MDAVREMAEERVVDRLVELLDDSYVSQPSESFTQSIFRQAVEAFGGAVPDASQPALEEEATDYEELERQREARRAELRAKVVAGEMDGEFVEIDTEEANQPFVQVFSAQGLEEMGVDSLGGFGTRRVSHRLSVADARPVLFEQEAASLIDKGSLHREAIERAEQTGIVFIDEIDKVAIKSQGAGPDVSREGVQRDLLPVIEGSTVPTKFGPVRTDHILFICAGAFHMAKPSDLIPELQGRLPIRVQLTDLAEADFRRILREPKNALTKQYERLLGADGVTVSFTEGALDEIARLATEVNKKVENIGARRLHTIVEKLLEDIMFEAPECGAKSVSIDDETVRTKLGAFVKNLESSRYIL